MAESPAEARMREILDRYQLRYVEQGKVNGHRIDFVVERALVEPNGDRWHRWSKIVECDRVKLNRVLLGDRPGFYVPLGIWWSRLQKADPQEIVEAVVEAAWGRLAWWDWGVHPEELEPEAQEQLATMLPRRLW